MSASTAIRRHIAAAIAAICAGLSLATTAGAVDLRDWGRTFPTSQRFVVLSQFKNQAVLDKETQLVWQAIVPDAQKLASWIAAYTGCMNAKIGARRGWRLPAYAEFSALFADGASSTPIAGIPNGVYWTATAYPASDTGAHSIHVPTGVYWALYDNKTNLHSYVCVRGPLN